MQPNNPNPSPAPSANTPPTPPPTIDNVVPAGPVLVDNVPVVVAAAPASMMPTPLANNQAAPAPIQQHAKPVAAPKPKQHKASEPKPWAIIFIALIVAVVLAAFAFQAYK